MSSEQICKYCAPRRLERGGRDQFFCYDCGWNKDMQEQIDLLTEKLKDLEGHSLAVQTLLSRDASLIKLIVGPSKTELHYNKALLGFYSLMLDRACFSGFQESAKGEIELPEDDEKGIKTFGAWTQSGILSIEKIYGKDREDPVDAGAYSDDEGDNEDEDEENGELSYDCTLLARLWVLGNKLLAPKFCNAVMRRLIKELDYFKISYATVRYIFDNTLPTSKLRVVVIDRIQSRGPFREKDSLGHHRRWLDYIEEGGEFVRACVAAGGFHNENGKLDPTLKENQVKYMEDETGHSTAEAWRQGEF